MSSPSDDYLRSIKSWMGAYDRCPPVVREAMREALFDNHHNPRKLYDASCVLNPVTIADQVRVKDAYLQAQRRLV